MEYYEVNFEVVGHYTVGVNAKNVEDAIEKAREKDIPFNELCCAEGIAIEVTDYEGNSVWKY